MNFLFFHLFLLNLFYLHFHYHYLHQYLHIQTHFLIVENHQYVHHYQKLANT
jgi:hypothetical protein